MLQWYPLVHLSCGQLACSIGGAEGSVCAEFLPRILVLGILLASSEILPWEDTGMAAAKVGAGAQLTKKKMPRVSFPRGSAPILMPAFFRCFLCRRQRRQWEHRDGIDVSDERRRGRRQRRFTTFLYIDRFTGDGPFLDLDTLGSPPDAKAENPRTRRTTNGRTSPEGQQHPCLSPSRNSFQQKRQKGKEKRNSLRATSMAVQGLQRIGSKVQNASSLQHNG